MTTIPPLRRTRHRQPAASRVRRIAVVLLAALFPGGCAAAIGAGAIAATGKNPVDHIYSLASGKDCSLVRMQRGLTYCVEDEVVIETAVHCYPTLGEATCYRAADPFPGAQQETGASLAPAGAGGRPAPTPPKTN